MFSAPYCQGEILVLVGFSVEAFPPVDAQILVNSHKFFFNNILGNCGPIRKGNDRPYSTKLADALKIPEESLGRKQLGPAKGQLFLPLGFYTNLLNMLCDNPLLKGMNSPSIVLCYWHCFVRIIILHIGWAT
jgi:hypothetical protein